MRFGPMASRWFEFSSNRIWLPEEEIRQKQMVAAG